MWGNTNVSFLLEGNTVQLSKSVGTPGTVRSLAKVTLPEFDVWFHDMTHFLGDSGLCVAFHTDTTYLIGTLPGKAGTIARTDRFTFDRWAQEIEDIRFRNKVLACT